MKKILLVLIIVILASFAYADPSFYFKKGSNIDIKIPCVNQVTGNACTSTTCNITINYPNGSNLVNNQPMTANPSFYNYSLSNPNVTGIYSALDYCSNGSIGGFNSFDFMINNSGNGDKPNSIQVMAAIFFLALAIGFMIWALWLPSNNSFTMGENDTKLIEIEYGKYVKLLFFFMSYIFFWLMTWLLADYATSYILSDTLNNFLNWMFLIESILILPLFILTSAIAFVKWLSDSDIVKWQKRGLLPR